jgi:signal transduction histidine kinase
LAVGCDGFLQKPINARTFAETVRGYLGGQREHAPADQAGAHLRLQSQRIVAHLEEKVAELSQANARLRELDHARKEFYRNISHELATPMTPIVGYVKLLRDQELGALSPPQQKALRAMDDCVQRLRGLIDDLLDVTGIETGRMRFAMREYDLRELAERALANYENKFRDRNITLHKEIPGEPLRGVGDPDRVRRAIEQLLDNAAKFTASGGVVGIRARRLPSGQFELCVADTGPGIPEDALERLFEPFYQVDGSPTRAHGGTGIGLAIVRGICRGLGGDVRVASPSREVIAGAALPGSAFTMVFRENALVAPPG